MKLHANRVALVTADITEKDSSRTAQPESISSDLVRLEKIALASFSTEFFKSTTTFGVGGVMNVICTDGAKPLPAAVEFLQAAEAELPALAARLRIAVHAIDSIESSQGSLADARHAAHLRFAAHGGQILVSAEAQQELTAALPPGCTLRDLGAHQLADLVDSEHVFQLLIPGSLHVFPPLRALSGQRTNLPLQATRFIGRADDMAAVSELIRSQRMVTLVGASGVGKTRLALQTAASMLEEMKDGVWFVEFPLLPDPSLIAPSLASALMIREDPAVSLTDAIVAALEHRQLLIVLDNCDAIRRGCAAIAETILARCPGVRIVASACEGLGAQGEALHVVRALTLPDMTSSVSAGTVRASEAGELFNECAMAAIPDFTLAHGNARAVARLVTAVGGIPCALQIAAHGVEAHDIESSAAGIEERIKFTGSGPFAAHRDVVKTVVGWCYDQLDITAQSALCRLSVMTGPFTKAAMKAVAPGSKESHRLVDAESTLRTLLAAGLVTVRQQNGVARYRVPDAVREYACERMNPAERTRARRRYAEYYLQMAEEAGSDLAGTDAARMALWLEREYPNLCAALAWCQEDPQQANTGLRLAASLRKFWEVRGYPAEGHALLLSAAVWGDSSDRTTMRADSLKRAGDSAFQSGNMATARARHSEALSINRELGDRARQAINLNSLGNVARAEGDHVEAQRLHEEALVLNREVGDQRREAVNLHNIGNAHRDLGDSERAHDRYVEAIAINLKLGDRVAVGHNLNSLARLAYARGDRSEALRLYEEALGHFRAAGSQAWVAHSLGEIVKLNLRPSTFWAREAASMQQA